MGECLVVTYHYVRDTERTEFPGIKALSVADFRSQLDWLCEHYRLIDYPNFRAALTGDVLLPEPTALLTFDDGLIDHYEKVLPSLLDRGLYGVFFVPTPCLVRPRMLNVHRIQFLLAHLGEERLRDEVAIKLEQAGPLNSNSRFLIEGLYRWDTPADAAIKQLLNYELPYKLSDSLLEDLFVRHLGDEQEFADKLYCSPNMLEEMSRAGMTLGGHTWNHRVLSRLSMEAQRKEVDDAPAIIRELTGQREIAFCYPYGLPATYSGGTLRILRSVGYTSAFTITPELIRFENAHRFQLPRLDTRDVPL